MSDITIDRTSGLDVKIIGNEVLRKTSETVREINPDIHSLAKRMIECMYEENGIGLAAPQIGENIRMFVIDTRDEEERYDTPGEENLCRQMPLALINPEITASRGPNIPFLEGCLSIPGINATVIRPTYITLKAQLLDGSDIEAEFGGLTSRCMQHEIDHLNGVLFTDIANRKEVKKQSKKLKALQSKGAANN